MSGTRPDSSPKFPVSIASSAIRITGISPKIKISLANLLYHTSGIRNYTVLAYYLMGYHESDTITSEEVYDLLLKLPSLNFKPGERWEYSDSNYFLLAKIVERITGQSIGEYARQMIFEPRDMHSTLFRD